MYHLIFDLVNEFISQDFRCKISIYRRVGFLEGQVQNVMRQRILLVCG